MLRLYRKWRLMIRLRNECVRHIGRPSKGFISIDKWGTIMVARGAFAQQTASRFWWSSVWSEAHKTKKLYKINSLLDSCISDGLVDTLRRDDGGTLIKTGVKGEDFCGYMDFLQAVSSRYQLAWRVVVPLITFAAGLLFRRYVPVVHF
jgi:hypothetical protein